MVVFNRRYSVTTRSARTGDFLPGLGPVTASSARLSDTNWSGIRTPRVGENARDASALATAAVS